MSKIIIIGSGIAGLTTALKLKLAGENVLVLTKEYPTRSQSSMAQGGINASYGEDVANHIADTLRSSASLGDLQTITTMCEASSEAIAFLDSIGVVFSRSSSGGIAVRQMGGALAKRAHYAEDYTGLKILHTLYDQALFHGIEMQSEKFLLEVLTTNKHGTNKCVSGVSVLDLRSGEVEVHRSSRIVLATGGYARLYGRHSTNSVASCGDGIAAALRAGAKLSNMEFVQFHPTALRGSSILISEASRGAGGILVNSSGERFIDELASRDAVSKAIDEEQKAGKEVFLDLRHLGEEFIATHLPQEAKLAKLHEGVEASKDLIPIKPAAHYTMGGVMVDSECKSSLDGLWCVGECADHGVHGANRLGGNSLLELVVFGDITAKSVAKTKPIDLSDVDLNKLDLNSYFGKPTINFYDVQASLSEIFYEKVGIVRDAKSLDEALEFIARCKADLANMGVSDASKIYNTNLRDFLSFINLLDVGEAAARSALLREESRGAHTRSDFLATKESFAKSTIIGGES